eukprot:TRINITY_DN88233_c0_g1_i1.p1 TRINITY_DN88233_c0_g1~~TRINITY_DN88233_c0_g1_i1.p1  ORF type:complete len:264 (-),score=26.92 TRINITY_DN88233_c0_g1_i1:430-1221(-)
MDEESLSPSPQYYSPYSKPKEDSIVLEDFELLKLLGRGSYGKVALVKKKSDPTQLYAMKILKKSEVASQSQIAHTLSERSILATINHPNVVRLKYAFHTPKRLYFVLEYCPGGELFFHLQQSGRFGERKARFYAANVVLALEYFHQQNVAYREYVLFFNQLTGSLKPENVLVGADGYAKITDFGLSKRIKGKEEKMYTFCGTPEYLAPEVIAKGGYTLAADWWSFGVFLCELTTGTPPFINENSMTLYKAIQCFSYIYTNNRQ